MAPDKIYVKMFSYGVGYVNSSKEKFKDEGIEYIRKNFLLEWANGKMTIEDETEGIIGGYNYALKELIDKLKSM